MRKLVRGIYDWLFWTLILKQPKLRRALQNAFIVDKDMTVRLLASDLRINSRNEVGYKRASQAQQRNIVFRDEIPKISTVMALIDNETTFVDCGANVGFWTCNIARLGRIYPGLKVLSFEANADTYRRLSQSAASYSNVQLFNVALSDSECILEMVEGATSGVFGVHKSAFQIGDQKHIIQAKPLDRFLGAYDKIIMKIDVEGHEFEVISGAKKAFSEGRVQAVFIDGFERDKRVELENWFDLYGFDLLGMNSLTTPEITEDRVLALKRNFSRSKADRE